MIGRKQINKIKEKSIQIRRPLPALLFLLFLDAFVFAFIFSLNHVFRPDILAIVVYLSLYFYLILTKRKKDIVYLLISSLLSILWTVIAKDNYGYNREMVYIFGFNAFPLFAWATGLAAFYLVYSDIERIFIKNSGYAKSFFLFSLLYFFFIIILETIAYHIFDIKNIATAIYPGLPICDCIHAPKWMQASYFLIGLIYFNVCRYFKLKMIKWN